MKLETLLNNVLPESSILFKHNHGLFSFYKGESDFKADKEYATQELNERVPDFLERVIRELIAEEAKSDDSDPSVSIDYAIYKDK